MDLYDEIDEKVINESFGDLPLNVAKLNRIDLVKHAASVVARIEDIDREKKAPNELEA